MKYLIILLFYFSSLYAVALQRNYMTNSHIIYASDIIPNINKNFILTKYNEGNYKITIMANKIIKLFDKHGYKLSSNIGYITFTQRSPIDMHKIFDKLKISFLQKYPNLDIISLKLSPISYMKKLPKLYTVMIPKYALVNDYSTIYIMTPEHREFFFNFTLNAKMNLFVAFKKISRHTKLTAMNTRTKFVNFRNFQGSPITSITNHIYQSKFTIQSGQIILKRDVEPMSLVRRGEMVTATVIDGGVSITFSAKALQSGRKGDIISILRNDSKQLRAVIIAPRMVQVQ